MITPILLIGEVYIDMDISKEATKMRLGGIVHAARGLWAADIPYSVAAIYPSYLDRELKEYLASHGCSEFHRIGEINNAPNVIFMSDIREISHQGYEEILREKKSVSLFNIKDEIFKYNKTIIFPGAYNLSDIFNIINPTASVSLDIAYGVDDLAILKKIDQKIELLAISTSSNLFISLMKPNKNNMLNEIKDTHTHYFLVKENRGGSYVYDYKKSQQIELPAFLDETVNSVGVGDVYTAVMAYKLAELGTDSAWRGLQAATCYSRTTFPDDLKRNLSRELNVKLELLKQLPGTRLSWESRKTKKIYLAAPDFSYIKKEEVDAAISALLYHNFEIMRPILINGEIEKPAECEQLKSMYLKDIELLNNCDLIFAIPLNRDPGTLVEIGYALAVGKPVIVYDPKLENDNTMVIGSAKSYSNSLDTSLNNTFKEISKLI